MAIALAACSAIPLSTVARLAAFGESDFASLDARELRVRVSMPEGVTTLRLAERSMGAFRELQRFMAARKAQSMRLDVQLKLPSAPPGASSVKVWIDVMPSTAQGYFTLVDGGTIPLNQTKTFGSSGS